MDTLVLHDAATVNASHSSLSSVNVHPVVCLSILDQHLRRGEHQDRAIGVLLGMTSNGVIEVTNSFGVFHLVKEGNVLIRRSMVVELLQLHKRVNEKESIVGWYSTVSGDALVDAQTMALHIFFSDFCARPMHLTIDTRLLKDSVDVHAYMPTNIPSVKK